MIQIDILPMSPGMGRPNGYHPVIDLDGTPGDRDRVSRPVCHGNGHLHYNLEKVRQTILEHESIFRSQLQELHHLYRRQKELTNEISRVANKSQSGFSFPPAPRFPTLLEGKVVPNFTPRILGSFCQTGAYRDAKLSLNVAQASQCNNADALPFDMHLKRHNTPMGDVHIARGVPANSSLVPKDFFQGGASLFLSGFRNERSGNDHRSEDYAEKRRFENRASVGDFCSSKLPVFPQERKEMSRRKRKLFGVEIEDSSSDVVTAGSTSWIDKTFAQNLELGRTNASGSKTKMRGENGTWLQRCSTTSLSNPGKCFTISQSEEVSKKDKGHPDCQNDQENPKGTLPWFLRNVPDGCDTSKGAAKSPYFMNLDSLQNCSQNFFRKIETGDGITLTQKKESSAATVNETPTSTTKILGFPILLQSSMDPDLDPNTSVAKVDGSKTLTEDDEGRKVGLDNYISDLRHCIDLNLSVDEEVSPSVLPSLPTTIVKIATAEIDLEAPAAIESDMDTSFCKECDQIAAEALVAISSHNDSIHEPLEATSSSDTSLKWFVEIISSQLVPDGLDYFEYTTLKLEEAKEEQYHQYEVVLVQNPTDDDCTKRSRRGVSRRAVRHRKDFQRDILPGLITLSRLEVTEDIQAFSEVMKAENGSSRQSGFARNSRGRKRSAGPALAATMRTTTAQQQPNCQMEDRSLTGWGKRTRRLPRQRCHNAFISFPVKC